jgi:hypothetical protein
MPAIIGSFMASSGRDFLRLLGYVFAAGLTFGIGQGIGSLAMMLIARAAL